MKATTYFHGDEAEYTGKTEFYAGATFYEIVMTEGHRKGETLVTAKPPNTTGKFVAGRFVADAK